MRTDDDYRALADRCIQAAEMVTAFIGRSQNPDCAIEACEAIARRLLSLLPPADDGEPLTLEWLKGVSGNGWGYWGHTVVIGALDFEPHAREAGGAVTLHPEQREVKRVLSTRGCVRRLAAAQGLALKEPQS